MATLIDLAARSAVTSTPTGSPTGSPAMDDAAQTAASHNQQVYQRLRLSLGLELRRQLFIGICDDLNLRNGLSQQLQQELTTASITEGGQASEFFLKGITQRVQRDRLVTLTLDVNDPNPIVQISQWLRQHNWQEGDRMPAFQIVGIEQLTRQPAAVQRLFLSYLRTIERHLPRLQSSLVLWVNHPWYHHIRQSAPECWQWTSGLFEFLSEPLPLLSDTPIPSPAIVNFAPKATPASPNPSNPDNDERPAPAPPIQSDLGSPANAPIETPSPSIASPIAHGTQNGTQNSTQNGKTEAPLIVIPATGSAYSINLNAPGIADPDPETDHTEAPTTIEARIVDTSEVKAPDPQASDSQTAPASQTDEADAIEDDDDDRFIGAIPALDLDSMGISAEELEEAQHLAHVEQLRTQDAPAEQLALAYLDLGRLYRDRLERNPADGDLLSYAIASYEQVLEWLCFSSEAQGDDSAIPWCDTLNDLGTLYWMAARQAGTDELNISYLKLSAQTYRLGLKRTPADQQPRPYAMLQNNLGTVHSDMAHHFDPIDNLQEAIAAYNEALRFRQPSSDPIKYAATQNNLGTAYWHLAQHTEPAVNLKGAIAAYSESAQHYTAEQYPDGYAMIQNNLGTAYWNLAQHISPNRQGDDFSVQDWLLLAINAYNNALLFRDAESAPSSYAATQNNLGTAYWQLASHCHEDDTAIANYMQRSIQAYEQALDVVRQLQAENPTVGLSFDPAATHSNLGVIHYQLANELAGLSQVAQQSHLDASLHHQVQAIEGWSQRVELKETAIGYLVQTIRKFYETWQSPGQTRALSQVPGHLLPQLLPLL